jgi:hypothetical protein
VWPRPFPYRVGQRGLELSRSERSTDNAEVAAVREDDVPDDQGVAAILRYAA